MTDEKKPNELQEWMSDALRHTIRTTKEFGNYTPPNPNEFLREVDGVEVYKKVKR